MKHITFHTMKKQIFILLLIGCCLSVMYVFTSAISYSQPITAIVDSATYVGPQTCASCHASEFQSWKTSHHYHAMEIASDSTVLANFNNTEFIADGCDYKFFRKKNDFYVKTIGADNKTHNFKIAYTFGFHPLQQYLIELPGGKIQVLRASWNVDEKKWFHQYSGNTISNNDWLHWTGGGQRWNTMCSDCHSTGVEKNYNATADTFNTTWQVLNVSCESCHGPASKHIEFVNSIDYKNNPQHGNSFILALHDSSTGEQINSCAPCHSRRMKMGEGFTTTENHLNFFIPQIPVAPDYQADGQIQEEDYEYTSFLQSKMYMAQVQCSNCHNPHSGEIKLIGNALCLQCHSKNLDAPAHTHHNTTSNGAQCINCHMPTHTYMGIDARHDHSFKIPRPDLSLKFGVTNACNQCHADKDAAWANQYFSKWYDSIPHNEFTQELIGASLFDTSSALHIKNILSNNMFPPAVKAAAIYYAGYISDPAVLQLMLQMLTDSSALIRYQILKSLTAYPSDAWMHAVTPLLSDKIKMVRLAAAELFTGATASVFENDDWENFISSKSEFENFLRYQFDFPSGHLMMGNYLMNENLIDSSRKEFLAALKMDSLLIPARIKLATSLSMLNKNDQALQQLKRVINIDSESTTGWYFLALLQNQLNDNNAALQSFQKAISLKPTDARVYYNFAIFCEQQQRMTDAETYYKKAVDMSPASEDYNYAIATFYFRQGNMALCNVYASVLVKLNPENKNYQQLYKLTHH